MTPITVFIVILLFVLWKTVIVVQAHEQVVKERLGKFNKVLEPGFHFMIPFFDSASYKHEMREQVIDVPSQNCITKDNLQIEVDGIVYLQVMDAYKASYGIADYIIACINLAQTTMRSEIGKLSLDQSFSERDEVNDKIVKEIDKASDPWGIKVLRYEIKNINPSIQLMETLEKQMEAERQKRADITLANAEKEATIQISEAERQEAINISEGESIKKKNEAEGKAREIELITEATVEGLQNIAKAIASPGGNEAVKLKIAEQYIQEFGNIASHAEVTVVPTEIAKVKTFFEGVKQVSQKLD